MSELIDIRSAIDALEKEKPTPFVNKDGSIDPFGAGQQNQWYRDGIAIMNLSPAEPVRMKGKWVKKIDESINAWWYECSVCGDYPLKNAFGYDSLSKFCPWCGAELSEGEESHEDIPEGSL